MVFYAIFHRKSKTYMPQLKGDRGYSHWNPKDGMTGSVQETTKTPRLFTSFRNANIAITMWLRFPNATSKTLHSISLEGEPEYDEDFVTTPDDRERTDVEIHELTLKHIKVTSNTTPRDKRNENPRPFSPRSAVAGRKARSSGEKN